MVSIIIPNYNHAEFLQKRIDSVLDQTMQDFEVIILDDCSTDNSKEIIEQYRLHPKISAIIHNDKNSGCPFAQWQKGISLASGEFIWIAESDDYADHRFLEILLPVFNDPKIGVVYSDSNMIDANNVLHLDFYKQYRNKILKTSKWSYDYCMNGILELRTNLFYECTINNTSAMIFRKSLVRFINFERLKTFRYSGDWYFFISLLCFADIAYKQEGLNYYRFGGNNFSPEVRSVLNYFKERFFVRYYFWNDLKQVFSKTEKIRLYKDLGSEMRIQINEVLKGKSSLLATLRSFYLLSKLNRNLYFIQTFYAFRTFIRNL